MASLSGLVSTPTMVAAPASLQATTTDSPTPPSPHTAHTESGATLAVMRTAPKPVGMQHPARPTVSRLASGLICRATSRSAVKKTSGKRATVP